MSVTKSYIDTMATGVCWHSTMPSSPIMGDAYTDPYTGEGYVWDGGKWVLISSGFPFKSLIPTNEELDKHASLRQAWEEYLIVRKLLGI